MGKEQDANWCVTRPWFDHLLGTRIEYEYDAQGRPQLKQPSLKDVKLPSTPVANDASKNAA